MSNPFFGAMGDGAPAVGGQMGNFMQMVQKFNEFRNSFQGDPKAEVNKLLQSGRMSQGQLNQLQEMAKQFRQLMG